MTLGRDYRYSWSVIFYPPDVAGASSARIETNPYGLDTPEAGKVPPLLLQLDYQINRIKNGSKLKNLTFMF